MSLGTLQTHLIAHPTDLLTAGWEFGLEMGLEDAKAHL